MDERAVAVDGDDDGSEHESVTTEAAHPGAGERVAVEVDPSGVFQVPVWDGTTAG